MITHSSILAWEISWTEPGGLQSMGLQRVATPVHTGEYGYKTQVPTKDNLSLKI